MKAKPLKRTYNIYGNEFGAASIKSEEVFVWAGAFADACGREYLHSYIWDMLCGYSYKDSRYGYKMYKTEEEAMQALKRVIDTIRRSLEAYD